MTIYDHLNDSAQIEHYYKNSDNDMHLFETRNEIFSDSSIWSTEPKDIETRI